MISLMKCAAVFRATYKQTHEPMYERDLTCGPWEKLGSDLFELDG